VLLGRFRNDWVHVWRGFWSMLRTRSATTPDERLAWLLIVATVPVGVVGLAFEHALRTVFAKPEAAAIFLTINGVLLFGFERLRRRGGTRQIDSLNTTDAVVVGAVQIGSLFAGISRSGVTMGGGLLRGLDHEHAAHFAFLLATPIILAAGVYKVPDLLGHNADGVRGQILAGSVVAACGAYGAVRFLERFFRTRTLTPFAIYCLAAGLISVVKFA
jgi:undecaprenyl-diphosphatase